MTGGKQRKQQSFAPLERDALMRCDASTRLTLWMTGSTGEWAMGMTGAEGGCPVQHLLTQPFSSAFFYLASVVGDCSQR